MTLILYIIVNLFYYVLKCFCFVLVWCPCMAINVSVYSITVGFSSGLYCRPNVSTMHDGNPFKYHEEVSYLQPMIPPPSDLRPNVTNSAVF